MLSSQVKISADRQIDKTATGKTICPQSIDVGGIKKHFLESVTLFLNFIWQIKIISCGILKKCWHVFFLFLFSIRSIRYIINGISCQSVFPVGCIYFSMCWKMLTSRLTFGLARYQIFQRISK